MLRYIHLAFKNALRNRRRAVLTISSIAVSLCLLGFLMAMYRVLFDESDIQPSQATRLFSHHKVSITQPLPFAYQQRIERIPGVSAVSSWQWFGGVYKDARDPRNNFARFGMEPEKLLRVWPEVSISEQVLTAFRQQRTACIVTQALASDFDWKPGDRITVVGDIFPITLEFTIAGTFDTPDHPRMLFFNREYLRESFPVGSFVRDMTGNFAVQTESADVTNRVAKAIDAMFENSPYPTTTESERAFQLSFVAFLGNMKMFLAAIFGAVTFTILLVSGNSLAMSVRERTREVGILKTLGFTAEAVLGIITTEAILLGLAGGIVGSALAALLCGFVRKGGGMAANFLVRLQMTPTLVFFCVVAAAIIGAASALIPAIHASRLRIVDSLRHTG